jgi:hypothetical protein
MYIVSAGAGGIFLKGPDGSGADQTGGFTAFDGGRGTGTGAGGGLFFRISPPAAGSSSTLNTIQDALTIRGSDGQATFGLVDIVGTPGNMSIQGPRRATGVTDGAGGTFNIFGSQGTGTGVGGDINLLVSPPAAGTGSAQNGNQNVVKLSGTTGNITLTGALPGGGTRGQVIVAAGTKLSIGGTEGTANSITSDGSSLVFEGSTANASETTVGVVDPTADTTWNIPALAAGTYTFAHRGDIEDAMFYANFMGG